MPKSKKIPENTWSYNSTLLPDLNSTCYPVFCPIPDPTQYIENPASWALLIIQKQLIELTTGVQASTALSKLSTSFNWSGPIGVARSIWGDDDNDEDVDDNVVDY